MNLTLKAKEIVGDFLKESSPATAIDATCGNGNDTLFLAQNVGGSGLVFAFDIQAQAIQNTRALLCRHSLEKRAMLFNASHARLDEHVPREFFGQIDAAMFNLGWLPKSDKKLTTTADTTLDALNKLQKILNPKRNLISLLAYRAHEGGENEYQEIKKFLSGKSAKTFSDRQNPASPVLFIFSL